MTGALTHRRGTARTVAAAGAIAFAAAAATYGLHHLSPADPHHADGVVALLVGVAILVVGPVALATTRRHPAPPAVLVPRSDRPTVRGYQSSRDVEVAAAIHAAELEHGFFVDLGPRFLRAYQRSFADSPHAVAVLAELDGHVVGMLTGVLRPVEHSRWVLKRRGVHLALAGAVALAVRPLTAGRFLRTRAGRYLRGWRRRRAEPITESAARPARFATLTHVAVVPGARGAGIGGALVEAFEQRARVDGVRELRLTTLPADAGAGPFYQRRGWVRDGTATTADDVTFDRYLKEL